MTTMRESRPCAVPSARFVLALGLSLLVTRAAYAAPDACFPPGTGVPGQPGVPNWWSGTAPSDDPRWLGSYGFSHGVINFNALVDTSSTPAAMVLRWHVKPDPGPAQAGDQVWVGFFNPATNAGTIVRLTRDASVTTSNGQIGSGVMTATAYTRTGTSGGWSGASLPSALTSSARLDVTCGTSAPIVCDDWTIRLRVPLTAAGGGIDLGNEFGMWYEVDARHSSSTADIAKWPVAARTIDPTTLPLTFPEPLGSTSPPSAAWSKVSVAGGTCVAGIDIQHQDILVANAIGTGTAIDVNSTNTFHIKPTNHTTTTFNPDSIKATLRIADWGSAVGDSPRWVVPDPSCTSATGSGAPASITPNAHFDLQCSWALSAGEKCAYRPDLFPGCTPTPPSPRYAHQCIMAELSSSGANIPFSRSSSWNNFAFDHSSRLIRRARIDIGTLSPRDVYVYIKTSKLPGRVPPLPRRGEPALQAKLSPQARERLGRFASSIPGRISEKEAAGLRALVASGRIFYDDVQMLMPTYTAYVWHDTGEVVATAHGSVRRIEPQPAFTLFISHDGSLTGWKHALDGFGGTSVTKIAQNFYQISVGKEGTAEVLTRIEALELPPVPPVNCHCGVVRARSASVSGLLLTLVIGSALLLRSQRRTRRTRTRSRPRAQTRCQRQ